MAEKKSHFWNKELGGVSRRDILFFSRHLAIALKNGLTLDEGLGMLYEEATREKWKGILKHLLETIRRGKSFYQALENYPQYFSPIYINLVKTGEMAGALEQNLEHLAQMLRKAEEFRQKIKSAMMYPLLIFIAVLGLGFSVAVFILPKILPLFKTLEVELPITTRGLIWIADVFSKNGLWILGGGILFLGILIWSLHRNFMKPFMHRLYLRLPGIGEILKKIELERFHRILGTLLQSSITLDRSLKITAEATSNSAYRQAILLCVQAIEKGEPLVEGLKRSPHLFPSLAVRMIGMGERTSSLESTLHYLSEFFEEEVDNTMKNLSTIIEPFLLIVIGLVVGVVAISILGPIYKITGNLRS